MSQRVLVEIDMPEDLEQLKLPRGVDQRMQDLLDRQDQGDELTSTERLEAEGLVNLSDFLSLLRLRASRVSKELSQ
ncbi:MAG: hypothetical protein IIC24_08465 [Chloroflexi bacterium]|nr:hypothetical protein [Chloroflexota bacterium]